MIDTTAHAVDRHEDRPARPLERPPAPLDGLARTFQVHRRVAASISSRTPRPWVGVAPWPRPTLTGGLAVIAIGCLWGSIIGAALGGTVGAVYLLIGAIYGAPIGAVVGLVVAVPASTVLAALLALRDRSVTDIHRSASHVSTWLAFLIELLTVSALLAVAVGAASEGQWALLLFAGPVLLLAAEATWLLRLAARDLVRAWGRAWGWKAVR